MKFWRLIFVLIMVGTAPAWAAVAVVGTPAEINAGGTYTAESGSNRAVVITLGNRTLDTSTSITPSVTALSFGSASLANGKILPAVVTSTGGTLNWIAGVWYIKEADIPAGSNTLAVTYSNTMQSNSKVGMYTLSGVDQNSSIDTTATKAQSSSTTWQQAITVAANSANISAAVSGGSAATATPDTGWTEVVDGTNGGALRSYSQYRVISSGGAYTWGLTVSVAVSGRIAIASFAPFTAGVIAPSFTSGPTKTANGTGGNTYSATPDLGGDTSATLTMGVYKAGGGCPSPANVAAGTGTGFVQKFTKSVTGADSISSTGLDYPQHDYCFVLTNGAGNSSVASDPNVFKSPPSGYIYDTLTSVSATSFCAGISSPSVASGDTVELTSPTPVLNQTVTIDGSCDWSFLNSGARDRICLRVYDYSAKDWMSITTPAASCPGTRAAVWFNNQTPSSPEPGSVAFFVPLGSAMTPVDLRTYCPDPEGDTVTVTCANLPTGLSCTSSTLQGTAAVRGIYTDPLFTCQDVPGDQATW